MKQYYYNIIDGTISITDKPFPYRPITNPIICMILSEVYELNMPGYNIETWLGVRDLLVIEFRGDCSYNIYFAPHQIEIRPLRSTTSLNTKYDQYTTLRDLICLAINM